MLGNPCRVQPISTIVKIGLGRPTIVGFNRWLGAILLASAVLTGCSGPKPPGYQTATPIAQVTTIPPVETSTPAATATDATPAAGESGTPAAAADGSGTPVAAAGGEDADYENAEGMTGYEEVLKLKAPASSPESVARGKALFAANCATCHGAEGKGDGDAGKALDPPPRNLHVKDEFKYGTGDRGIYRTIFYGVDGTGMAPLEGTLKPEEMWDIVHFVHTLQGT